MKLESRVTRLEKIADNHESRITKIEKNIFMELKSIRLMVDSIPAKTKKNITIATVIIVLVCVSLMNRGVQ